MIRSKLDSRGRTTIPLPVRYALRLSPGDELVYVIESGRIVLSKASPEFADNPFSIFIEWSSEEDRDGYADL
jgi:antitoxin PrlF